MSNHAVFAIASIATLLAVHPANASPAETISNLEGEWSGSGWIMTPEGARETFDIFESVKFAADGHAILIQGIGYAPAGAGREGEPVHNAIGLVFADGEGHKIRSVIATGQTQEADFDLREDGYDWAISLGEYGEVQYSATVTGDVWTETGSFCRAGAECVPTFYMQLQR